MQSPPAQLIWHLSPVTLLALPHSPLFAGQTILVLGAAGGVGLAAVQLARTMGARVIAVARGQDKMEALKRVSYSGLTAPSPSALACSALPPRCGAGTARRLSAST